MSRWFSWRTMVVSIIFSIIFSASLFLWTKNTLTLSGLDLFFAVTTVISLAFNILQLYRDSYKYSPIIDTLIGLFNDLKGRSLRTYQRQQLIVSPAGLDLTVEAVRLEFYDFVQETTQEYEQLREHVVALIHALDSDISNQRIFKAAEFGLNEQERRMREINFEKMIADLSKKQDVSQTGPINQ